MKPTEDQQHPPRGVSGPLYVEQTRLAAFAKTPAYEEALAAGRTIHVIRPDGTTAMQVSCPQDRLPCADDVERLEADNLSLRGVLRDLVNAHPRCGKCGQLNAAEINLCCLTRRVLGAPELAPALRAALEALKP